MYDAIVIGARCAGAPTAMLLARQGYRVLLLERASFPSDSLSTLLIHARGVAQLQRWGVLDAVMNSLCPSLSTFTLVHDSLRLTANILPVDGIDYLCAPRRLILDQLLVNAAIAAGAEFCDGMAVEKILIEDGRVTGIRGRTRAGTVMSARARIVIGADGLHSLLARTMQPPVYHAYPTLTCLYYALFSGLQALSLELYKTNEGGIGCVPTHDGLVLLVLQWPAQEFPHIRKNVAARFYAALEQVPHLAEVVRQGKQESAFRGTGFLPNYFRVPYGPGWAIVGDAGLHKDPGLAQGISDAFRDAQLLADAVGTGLSGLCPLEQALADYERQRNEATLLPYHLCIQYASFEPEAQEKSFLEALQHNQKELDRYVAVIQGTLPPSEIFSSERLQYLRGKKQHATE